MSEFLIGYFRRNATLQDQKERLGHYCGGSGSLLIASFYEEVESAPGCKWSALRAAAALCREARATLVICELGRLTRSERFTALLAQSGVRFTCLDKPSVTPENIRQLAADAYARNRQISMSTKKSLQQLKARGLPLGASRPASRNLSSEDMRKGTLVAALANSATARRYYAPITPRLLELRSAGYSFDAIAKILNQLDLRTTRGSTWNAMQVKRVLLRYSDFVEDGVQLLFR